MFITPTIFLWLLVLTLVFVRCYKFLFDKPINFPLGPPRFPLIGCYGILLMINWRHLHKAVAKLCQYYQTSILGMYLGDFGTVYVNDFDAVKEVLYRVEFDGRPDLFLARMREKNFQRRGIFFTEGPDWKEQRRFILRHLRDYGFGRRFEELEAETNAEIMTLIEMLKYGPRYEHEREFMKDGYVKCPAVFSACFANAFLHVFCGERIPREGAGVLFETGKSALKFQRLGDDFGTILSLLPWLKNIFPNATNYNGIREASLAVNAFIESIVQKHLASYDGNHIRSFLDLYFRDMQKTIPKEGDRFSFQYDQLILGIVDFFFPAISGATTQIALLMERLLLHPEVLNRMQAEIEDVVGNGRLPSLNDRINLPYTEATLREGMRIDTLVPSGIAHVATEDTTLRGYDIPKGTILLLGLDAIHNQLDVWGDPFRFRPERFLDNRGKLSLAKDISIPFGAGKRLCAGETFARNTMFLIVSALVQNFDLKQPPTDNLPDISKRNTGIIITPNDYWVKFVPR
ncbi:probable cytochrome P450 304a1 [Topomyia yanbarensis]|uniref:probable cytochrome P450 304a1 n=1 Tax=Topomyia yanbarensis TaxID=2498891 RepID=UPI00273AF7F1|nr:probable cytochrome P450 304a1 [Topomyia yanbarensis]